MNRLNADIKAQILFYIRNNIRKNGPKIFPEIRSHYSTVPNKRSRGLGKILKFNNRGGGKL